MGKLIRGRLGKAKVILKINVVVFGNLEATTTTKVLIINVFLSQLLTVLRSILDQGLLGQHLALGLYLPLVRYFHYLLLLLVPLGLFLKVSLE